MYYPMVEKNLSSQFSNYLMCFMQAITFSLQLIFLLGIGLRRDGIIGIFTIDYSVYLCGFGDIAALTLTVSRSNVLLGIRAKFNRGR